MSAQKKTETTEEITATTAAPAAVAPETPGAFVVVPQKICAQIGLRKRYFDTIEAAQVALDEFIAKSTRVKGTRSPSLTPEQKAEKAHKRCAYEEYATTKGLEGKRVAMLANTLEELGTDIPGVHALIASYVASRLEEQPAQEAAVTQEETQEEALTSPEVDPLAEFN